MTDFKYINFNRRGFEFKLYFALLRSSFFILQIQAYFKNADSNTILKPKVNMIVIFKY